MAYSRFHSYKRYVDMLSIPDTLVLQVQNQPSHFYALALIFLFVQMRISIFMLFYGLEWSRISHICLKQKLPTFLIKRKFFLIFNKSSTLFNNLHFFQNSWFLIDIISILPQDIFSAIPTVYNCCWLILLVLLCMEIFLFSLHSWEMLLLKMQFLINDLL